MKSSLQNSVFCTLLTLLTTGLISCQDNTDTTTEKEILKEVFISRDTAQRYVNNFGRNHAFDSIPATSLTQESPNTRVVWFELKKLKAFINKIEKENGDGVRIYFAAYDSTYSPKNPHAPDKMYWGHNTLILVPTRDSSGIHMDYFKVKNAGKGMDSDAPTAVNRAGLCPPPTPCQGAELLE